MFTCGLRGNHVDLWIYGKTPLLLKPSTLPWAGEVPELQILAVWEIFQEKSRYVHILFL